ncbi:ATP-binding cassette domain-containing protein [Rothia aerolata]|uniref:ATP-binding cassette domain-containing protein n=1 Tax=Rothia aerolata TaxID=1812262 RepID=UPI001668497A|nr:ABC transporter ATP-binding protein [Rothia aerolata]
MVIKAEEQQGKKPDPVRLRLTPPDARYSRFRWFLPFFTQLLAGTAIVSLPALVAHIITLHSQGSSELAWNFTWFLGGVIILLSFNELFGYGTAFRTIYMIERDWKLHTAALISRVAGRSDAGQIIALINKDARNIANMYMPLLDLSAAVPIMLFGTVQLWLLSPLVAGTTLLGFFATVLALTAVSRVLEKRADVFRDKIGLNASKASDIASSIRTILGLGAGRIMMTRYSASAEEVRASQMRYESVQSWSSALRVSLIGFITLLAVGFALRGSLLNGSWVPDIPASQLVTVTGIITMMMGPLWAVEMTLFNWRNARVALKRVERLERQAESSQNEGQDDAVSPASIPPPAYLPQGVEGASGVLYFNPKTAGVTAQTMSEEIAAHLRAVLPDASAVLLSEPNPTIFAGTLRQHLELGTGGLSDREAEELLRITDSEEIARRLGGNIPADYFEAGIASEGTNLSGGQRQRLALARALAQKRSHLVLAEPLNSVDEPSQRFILDQLETLVAQPGPLEKTRAVYLVSGTVEVQKRINREATSESHPVERGS